MNIGVAGLGSMGAAIAAHLIDLQHTVTVWNRSPEKVKPLAAMGAKVASSPAELAGASEVVITILTDAAAIDAMYGGSDGLLSRDVAGKLFIEMSTVRPEAEIALSKKIKDKGAVLVECPVGGSTAPARDGKLFGFAGGETADVARARPILDQLCRRVEYCGPAGSGALVKLAINLPLMIAWQAFGEAFALVRDLGFTPERLVDIFADTNGANSAVKARAPKVAMIMAGKDAGPVSFTLANAVKDARAMAAEGKARGVDLPLIELTAKCFAEAADAGWGARDASAQPVYWIGRDKS
jgi:3-hydroxyisobutyrate dehydrogenase